MSIERIGGGAVGGVGSGLECLLAAYARYFDKCMLVEDTVPPTFADFAGLGSPAWGVFRSFLCGARGDDFVELGGGDTSRDEWSRDVAAAGVCGVELPAVAGSGVGLASGVDVKCSVGVRGKHWEANKKRREKKKEKKRHQVAGQRSSGVSGEQSAVPEWRRKSVPVASGYFAGCDVTVRDELRESRAKMMIAQNKLAVSKAEQANRVIQMRLQSRQHEEEVEISRLKTAAAYEKLAAQAHAAVPPGYVHTLLTIDCAEDSKLPSLASGSISPDSSISVDQVRRLLEVNDKLIAELAALRLEVTKKEQAEVAKRGKPDYSEVERFHDADIFFELQNC